MESERTVLWLMGLLSLQTNAIPTYLHQLYELWKAYRDNSGAFSHIQIPEYEEHSMGTNEIYRSVRTYLSSLEATANAPTVSITRPTRSSKLGFTLPAQRTVEDDFRGAKIRWSHEIKVDEKQGGRDRANANIWNLAYNLQRLGQDRKYVLKISNKDKTRVLSAYLDHISDLAYNLQRLGQERKLFSNDRREGRASWSSVAFKHPSTFESLALDPVLKNRVKNDLDCFRQNREFYQRTGRAWKRGYLLYGPPGTGKSSLIAAIANYMNYDVYDLELTKVYGNSDLRELLLATSSKSVIVIEDIDCAANLSTKAMCRKPGKHGSKVSRRGFSTITLSGLLNFADGLWSSCGEEKIMIFTTNHKERLDPALLRSGRMDMHILLSFCGFEAFKQLVFNYLDVEDHKLFGAVEEKMESGGCLTPADICEILIQNKSDPDSAIMAVVDALEGSKRLSEEAVSSGNESSEDEEEESPSSSSSLSDDE